MEKEKDLKTHISQMQSMYDTGFDDGEKTIKDSCRLILECMNCRLEQELPTTISVMQLTVEANDFYKKHRTRIGNMYCSRDDIFLINTKTK